MSRLLAIPALFLMAAFSGHVLSATPTDIPTPPPAARFITAICSTPAGDLWLGTEGAGLFHYEAQSGNWTRITRQSTGGAPEPEGATLSATKPGILGDDCIYALACDRQGRIWAGHLNHGVSVFNGKTWRNYDAFSGPLGERVFDIKICPLDGSAWMATSRGLARYRTDADAWEYFVEGDGKAKPMAGVHRLLPTNLIRCLSFASDGTLYAGTSCEGLIVLAPMKNKGGVSYTVKRHVIPAQGKVAQIKPIGLGLPSDQIHAVLASTGGSLWVATNRGLAFSSNQGASFSFVRGEDWDDKAGGWLKPAPRNILAEAAKKYPTQLVLEDDIRCLAEDEAGNLWLGHWSAGAEVLNGKTMKRMDALAQTKQSNDFSGAFCAIPGGMVLGRYDGGMTTAVVEVKAGNEKKSSAKAGDTEASLLSVDVPFPASASPPKAEDLRAYAASIPKPGKAKFFGEDWSTTGDWVGRYGRQYAVLCAAAAPYDHVCVLRPDLYQVVGSVGPHVANGEGLRHWLHALEYPGPNALWDPYVGLHREAEWDDHGETYPRAFEGPDMQATIEIKAAGVFVVSGYFFNPNGHGGTARFRDYLVELKEYPQRAALPKPPYVIADDPAKLSTLARARVHDFAGGGVYERFMVKGPGRYILQARRNGSFNTIVNGVFVDRLEGADAEASYHGKLPCLGKVVYGPPEGEKQTAWRDTALTLDPIFPVLAMRAQSDDAQARWQAGQWTAEDRSAYRKALDEGYRQFAEQCARMNNGWVPRRR